MTSGLVTFTLASAPQTGPFRRFLLRLGLPLEEVGAARAAEMRSGEELLQALRRLPDYKMLAAADRLARLSP